MFRAAVPHARLVAIFNGSVRAPPPHTVVTDLQSNLEFCQLHRSSGGGEMYCERDGHYPLFLFSTNSAQNNNHFRAHSAKHISIYPRAFLSSSPPPRHANHPSCMDSQANRAGVAISFPPLCYHHISNSRPTD